MAQNWAKMAQKLAPAKKIAEIYLQYLQLFASLVELNSNTSRLHWKLTILWLEVLNISINGYPSSVRIQR